MPREILPVTIWRESLCFWMRMAQANAEFGLRMWRSMGIPAPRPMDVEVERICEAAAHPAEVPDPVTAQEATPAAAADSRRKPAARKAAPAPVPAA
jgi:hypothetical protein